jgi:hypothetical protein
MPVSARELVVSMEISPEIKHGDAMDKKLPGYTA